MHVLIVCMAKHLGEGIKGSYIWGRGSRGVIFGGRDQGGLYLGEGIEGGYIYTNKK